MAKEYYPPVGFYFTLSFSGVSNAIDSKFQEVSGISVERGVKDISEGGEMRFRLRLPTEAKYSNLVLKRGMLSRKSNLLKWIHETITSNYSKPIQPKTIFVTLLDADGNPLVKWSFINAWPVKWGISDLASMKNEIVVENLDFTYDYFETSYPQTKWNDGELVETHSRWGPPIQ